MKQKKYFILAAAAALFAACSSDDIALQEPATQPAQQNAVSFDVYTQRGVTRGGVPGSVTTANLKSDATDLGKAGFGVFGFYTDNNDYDQRSTPNFFYNQQVYWDNGAFTYTPIKYWPNEYRDNAISDDADKVTYFAYAPWVEVVPTSGKLKKTDAGEETWGITGMTRNNNQGDPILKYIGSFDSKYSVDLCWGVVDNGDANWNIVRNGQVQTSPSLEAGLPWQNVYRPAGVEQKVRFTFKHATAQMKVMIDADVDVATHSGIDVAEKTRVWVRQVTFNGFTMKGALNLNNQDAFKPLWLDYNGQNDIVAEDLVVYDGRKDGKEGVSGAVASNEKSVGLNPILIQDAIYQPATGDDVYANNVALKVGTDRVGVTKNQVNLFNNTGSSDLFYVIPTDDNLEIEIVYDIETVDGNLSNNLSDGQTKGSSVENRIRQSIKIEGQQFQLQAGHSYAINLHLGMNSVKFDAAVTDWIEEPAQDVDLPANTPLFPAGDNTTNPATHDVTLPYNGNYTFAITGLAGGESITQQEIGYYMSKNGTSNGSVYTSGKFDDNWTATNANAKTNGVAVQTLRTSPNPTTTTRKQIWQWTGNQSGFQTKINFTQAAHPLFMTARKLNTDDRTIVLDRHNGPSVSANNDWTQDCGWLCTEDGTKIEGTTAFGDPEADTPRNGINVYRNGAKLEWIPSGTPTGNQFTFSDKGLNNTMSLIVIGDDLQVDDVIKVVLKTGSAPIETVSFTVK